MMTTYTRFWEKPEPEMVGDGFDNLPPSCGEARMGTASLPSFPPC